MPELPEVQTVLDGFAKVVEGHTITALECYYPGTVIMDENVTGDVFPARVIHNRRRGKYMILSLDSGYEMIVHLRMTGKLVYDPEPEEPGKHERARLLLDDRSVVHFIDIRTFGKITLALPEDLQSYLPELGPEPLERDFSAEYLERALKNKAQPVKTALLDQRIVAGLGNIYVCEILYRCKIDPSKPAGKLGGKALKSIVRNTREVLGEALSANGTSISDFRSIDDKTGGFQEFLRVYQKSNCPLGHSIANVKLGGRSSFYCPVCQK
ncbi:MAG TPA: bifunctional DNA-formamidopyrimidine glycosylase/DNA-(apurinic or apyrimidinic site) lyase [Candidatus Cloacimonadota bacterium]|nr:bifunctional DNA-formamidopyrimidine glycosylase/DNA-(apurinic or apyrimidinic site) lyase [Candidatus Cloacimonadota bacterium]HPS38047.1 bifunctional DNA-formamidopyrimidine glycosylase/DNA-(apurinic or apyrimidinic site) lyase [Candidatus Cloacimonadota bacterium]